MKEQNPQWLTDLQKITNGQLLVDNNISQEEIKTIQTLQNKIERQIETYQAQRTELLKKRDNSSKGKCYSFFDKYFFTEPVLKQNKLNALSDLKKFLQSIINAGKEIDQSIIRSYDNKFDKFYKKHGVAEEDKTVFQGVRTQNTKYMFEIVRTMLNNLRDNNQYLKKQPGPGINLKNINDKSCQQEKDGSESPFLLQN